MTRKFPCLQPSRRVNIFRPRLTRRLSVRKGSGSTMDNPRGYPKNRCFQASERVCHLRCTLQTRVVVELWRGRKVCALFLAKPYLEARHGALKACRAWGGRGSDQTLAGLEVVAVRVEESGVSFADSVCSALCRGVRFNGSFLLYL
jgi:hypothetical protein